ncbi:MAG: EamA family transporter [Candidatus Omnitrophica bacterium]|nr:EamA family transporter [Candidatus Omnitrophota bacterium]
MKSFHWALLTVIIWGFVPFLEKIGLNKLPVMTALFFRCMGVMVGISALMLFKLPEVKQALTNPPSGWHYVAIGGLLASVIGQIFFYNALKTGDVSKVTPMAGSFPLVTFLLGVLILKEALTLNKAFGVLFIIIGVFLLN